LIHFYKRMHEKLFESTISIKSYRPTLLFDKRCKNIKLWSKEEKSPPDNKKVGFKSNIEIVDQDLNVSSSTSCSDGDLSVDELKIDPQNQKEVTNESCLIISNVDCETNFITLIYNLNDKWIEWKIDCQNILILNSGVRVNVASQLKIGMIGNIIGIVNRESELELTCDNVMCLWLRYRQFLNICACDWSVDTNHELSLVEIDIWIMSLLVWRSKSWAL